jgi:hypothetical protein
MRVTCPNCGSKLNAKEEWIGKTGKCPKCSNPVKIVADAPADPDAIVLAETVPDQHIQPAIETSVHKFRPPLRLNRESHYLICDSSQLLATWSNNGSGWMTRAGSGFISAKRNRDGLPAQGDFKFIELKFAMTPEGKRLTGLEIFQLVSQWALNTLQEGDDTIAEKITGHACMNREQKSAVRKALKDQFMRPVWENATAVLEYLASSDFHTSVVGD